jgi:WD40 repeat protein
VSDQSGSAVFADPKTGAVGRRLEGFGSPFTPSLSRDGRLMGTIGTGGVVVLRTLRDGRPSGRPRGYFPTNGFAVSLSPDGRTIAVATGPGGPAGVQIVDVKTLRPRTRLLGSETVVAAVRFTPDGRFLAAGSIDGWVRLWSTATWRPASPRLAARIGEVMFVAVSPDGTTLAAAGSTGSIQLFDVRSQQPIGTPLTAVRNRPVEPLFTRDGAYLFGLTDAGLAYRWDVRPSSWARQACAIAARRLTRAEWQDVLPGRDYAPAC